MNHKPYLMNICSKPTLNTRRICWCFVNRTTIFLMWRIDNFTGHRKFSHFVLCFSHQICICLLKDIFVKIRNKIKKNTFCSYWRVNSPREFVRWIGADLCRFCGLPVLFPLIRFWALRDILFGSCFGGGVWCTLDGYWALIGPFSAFGFSLVESFSIIVLLLSPVNVALPSS